MMRIEGGTLRALVLAGLAGAGLSACATTGPGPADTPPRVAAEDPAAATAVTPPGANEALPPEDARGVITYPDYQVAITRDGDTMDSVANRIGVPATQLASYNGLPLNWRPRAGDTLVVPPTARSPTPAVVEAAPVERAPDPGITATPLDGSAPASTAPGTPAPGWSPELAANAIARADAAPVAENPAVSAPADPGQAVEGTDTASLDPLRHNVTPGETIYSIARLYDVPVAAVAALNGLGRDYTLRPGQEILIPIGQQTTSPPEASVVVPGEPAPIASPPSAADPLPPPPTVAVIPPSPNLDQYRSPEPATRTLQRPVTGQVARPYSKSGTDRNDGIDFAADGGAQVLAADEGEVALISNSLGGLGKIVLIRHADGLTTVYGRVDGLTVQKGDRVARGQVIGIVAPTASPSLHFEVRKGAESVDPAGYL